MILMTPSTGLIWSLLLKIGTSVDSEIGAAAVHAGVVTLAGGTVTLEVRPGFSAQETQTSASGMAFSRSRRCLALRSVSSLMRCFKTVSCSLVIGLPRYAVTGAPIWLWALRYHIIVAWSRNSRYEIPQLYIRSQLVSTWRRENPSATEMR